MALSPDGQWLLSVNAQRQLLRQSVKVPNRIERIGLPGPVSAIAASHSGRRVAVALANGELGVVGFALRNSPGGAVLWRIVPGDSHSVADRPPTCFGDSSPSTGRAAGPQAPAPRRAVAISGDGRLVAVSANPIVVYDGDSGELIQCIPTGDASADDIRFVDHDTKLVVVQASGKAESLYSTWDVRKGELLNLHAIPRSNTRGFETPTLRNVDRTGRMIVPASETSQGQALKPWKRIDLRACSSAAATVPDPAGLDGVPYIDRLVDPWGRWIVRVTPTGNAGNERASSHVEFLDINAGTILSDFGTDAGDPLMLSNGDGSTLLGIAGPPTRSAAASGFRVGDGPLWAFPINPPPTASEAADESAAWPNSPCPIEDEVDQARSVRDSAQRAVRQFIVPIDGSSSWHQTPGGPLWVDTGDEIEQYDPSTGRLLNSIVKPKSAAMTAKPWYAREEFIGWQGDTVTRRSFADPTDPKRRIVVAKRPGWVAIDARSVGEHIEVRWATPVCAKKKRCNEGDESTAYYDDQGTEIPRATADSARQEGGVYSWSRSYFGSVRARLREPDRTEKTVMWIGLRTWQWADPRPDPEDSTSSDDSDDSTEPKRIDWRHSLLPRQSASVLPLDGRIGVFFSRSGVWIYDAETRALLGRITQEHTTNVAWNPDTRIIVVESRDTMNDIHLLRGYLIEGAPASAVRHSGAQKQ